MKQFNYFIVACNHCAYLSLSAQELQGDKWEGFGVITDHEV